MEADAGKGFGCQKIMDGKANDGANVLDKAIIPSCCLKARASDPEVDAKCHSTVVSGWFSEPLSCTGIIFNFLSSAYASMCLVKIFVFLLL